MKIKQQQPPYYLLPFLLFAIAVCFLVALLFTIHGEVFFSGDAGLKFLMLKQVSKGGSYTALNLESSTWVNNVWSRGFYPFKAPFVYNTLQGKTVSFPPAFQLVSALFYSAFGFKGIYIIPAVSLVILWLWFILLLNKIKIKPLISSFAFVLLAFCSPLTIYGAIYWEHTLALVLSFSVVVFILSPGSSISRAVVLGMMTGASVWFRPEMLPLSFMFVAVMVLTRWGRSKMHVAFIIALLTVIVAFFIFNASAYQNILGAHSYQLLESAGAANNFAVTVTTLLHLNARLVIYFPAIIIFYATTFYLIVRKNWLLDPEKQLTLIVILFLFFIPFFLPNAGGKQWGPRYFLSAIPIVLIVLCLAANKHEAMKTNKWIWVSFIFLLMYGMYLNVFKAYSTLKNDYAFRVKPGLDFMKNDVIDVVVVQNQFIAQEFSALLETKQVFLAEDQKSFNLLQSLLKANNVLKVLYVTHDQGLERLPLNLITKKKGLQKIGDYYFAEYELAN